MTPIDPVCLVHGKKRSEHLCLYCCLCFKSLTLEECHVRPDGTREDICADCAEIEKRRLQAVAPEYLATCAKVMTLNAAKRKLCQDHVAWHLRIGPKYACACLASALIFRLLDDVVGLAICQLAIMWIVWRSFRACQEAKHQVRETEISDSEMRAKIKSLKAELQRIEEDGV